jgi:CheY-like chemotaxis protein
VSDDSNELSLILVVEDVEETRDGIEKLLIADGYRVDPTRDEDDAVMRADRTRPNLILLSLSRLAVDIIATGLRIRHHANLSEAIPVVIVCIQTIAEVAEVEVERNVHLIRSDNFDQLRSVLHRLHYQLPATS